MKLEKALHLALYRSHTEINNTNFLNFEPIAILYIHAKQYKFNKIGAALISLAGEKQAP